MYSVSESYKNALLKKVINDTIAGSVTLADGTEIQLNDSTVVSGSLKISHELCRDYAIGTFNLGSLKIGFFDDNALLHDFSGAEIKITYKIETDEGWEEIPMGIFIADGSTVRRKRSTITLTAYDYGILFDCAVSDELRAMTDTAENLIKAVCEKCGVVFGGMAEGLPNTEILLTPSSAQIQSCRDLVEWCAVLLCGYAVIDRAGELKIISARYDVSAENSTDIIIDKYLGAFERDSFYSTDTRSWIATLSAYSGDNRKIYKTAVTQSDEQAARAVYTLEKNPLLADKDEAECDEINTAWLRFIDGFKQRGITTSIYGDPALDAGDVMRCSEGDIDQRLSIVGLITKQEWRYRNFHSIVCACAQLADGFPEEESAENDNEDTVSDKPKALKVTSQLEKRLDGMKTGGSGVGIFVNEAKNAERFNDYNAVNSNAGEYSHAEGGGTASSGWCAHAEGNFTKATGDRAHAEGGDTEAAAECTHAEGFRTKATGINSHSEGNNTTASGAYSHAEGQWCTASGTKSHAEGSGTKAAGACSHASGKGTIAAGEAQAVFGRYNIEDSGSLFIIGCGTSDERANALWVDGNGNLYVRGSVSAGSGTIEGAVYTAGNGVEISGDNIIMLKIGEGLEFNAEGQLIIDPKTVKLYTAGGGIEISEDNTISFRLGNGLSIAEDGTVTAAEYEAGDGLALEERKFSVKLGNGLELNDDGAIEATGTGGSYSAGDGIEITANEEDKKISVMVGEGLEIDENGAVSSMINADNAILIQEKDAKYLLHSYTQVDYIKGNKVCYAGPLNQIVVGGYICYAYKGTALNGVVLDSISTTDPSKLPDIPMYTSFAFSEPYLYYSVTRATYKTFEVKMVSMDTLGVNYSDTYLLENDTAFAGTPYKAYAGYDMGCAFLWQSIIKPGDSANGKVYPYGGVTAVRAKRYKSNATTYVFSTDSTWTLPFASEAEYKAAVGLTYEPVTLTEVQETVTEV